MSKRRSLEELKTRINELEKEVSKLKEDRNQVERILSSVETGLSIINPDHTINWVNDKIRDMFPGEKPIGQACHKFYESSEEPCDPCSTFQCFQTGKSNTIERYNPTTEKWYRIISQPVTDNAGNVVSVLEGITEITERKRAEQAILREREFLKQLMETSPVGISVVDREGQLSLANFRAEEILGLKRSDIYNRRYDDPAWQITDSKGNEYPEDQLPFQLVKSKKSPVFGIEHAIVWPNGKRALLSINGAPLFDSEGNFDGMVSTIEDVTERKRAEEALLKSEKRLIVAQHIANMGDFTWDVETGEVTWSDALFDLLQYDKSEKIDYARVNEEIHHPDDLKRVTQWLNDCTASGKAELTPNEYRLVRKDGKILYVRTLGVIEREVGKSAKVFATLQDITERKQMETQLQQSQKMEAVGTLSAGIAHDYNNLLAVIMGNLSMVQEEAEPHSAMAELLHEIEQASYKARDLTQQFLTLSEGGHPRKELGTMESLLKEIPKQVQANENLEYIISIQDDLWFVEYDSKQIQDAVTNVLKNAVEAMPQGGALTVQAENRIIDNKVKDPALPLNEGRYVRISIKDEGPGISEEHMDKVFDPYFSTKERGAQKGMGLGLTTAYAVVQKHGGHIMVNSTTGVGTTVTIYLPAAEEKGEPETVKQEREDITPSTSSDQTTIKRILVMDDEEMLRNLAQMMLERLGHEVETVADGDEAIETYKKRMDSEEPFDAVVLDLTIKGGMGGAQTIKELIKIDPDVKAIVCSGYFNDPVLANYEEHGFRGAMAKPYQKADLESVLKKVLG
jgi:PAS domain S-box-containing protein